MGGGVKTFILYIGFYHLFINDLSSEMATIGNYIGIARSARIEIIYCMVTAFPRYAILPGVYFCIVSLAAH